MDGIKLPADIEQDNLNIRMERIERKLDMLLERSSTAQADRLLDVRGVSHHCKVSPQTVYNWVSMHKIPCYRLNGKLLFAIEEVEDFLLKKR